MQTQRYRVFAKMILFKNNGLYLQQQAHQANAPKHAPAGMKILPVEHVSEALEQILS